MSIVQNSAQKSKWYLPGVIGGLGITMKHLLKNLISKKSMQTINYPEEKYEYGPRFKGNHILTVKKDGSLRCTACMLCATNCPAECIKITASENPDPKVEKFPISYEIDILRCVFCGFCEEACPVDAIVETNIFEYFGDKRGDLYFTKEMLLAVGDKYEKDIAANRAADAPYR